MSEMQCRQCGAGLPDGAKFCARCGTATVEAGAPQPAHSADRTAAQSAPTAAAVESAAELLAAARRAWVRVGSAQLAAVIVFVGAATLFGLVGLVMTLSASSSDIGKAHGIIWLGLASVLALAAVGWCAVARGPFAGGSPWPRAWDVRLAAGAVVIATVFSLIGIIAAYGSDPTAATFDGSAWLMLAEVVALASFGWMILTRPLAEGQAPPAALACTAAAVLLGLIGLVVGLGGDGASYVRGAAWLAWALVWAIIGTAALLSRTGAGWAE